MQFIESVPSNPAPGGAYSLAIALPEVGLLQLAGHVGLDVDGRRPDLVEDEIALALDNLERTLVYAGCTLNDVVQVTCLLTDIADFPLFDAVYRTKFDSPWPTRATFGVALAGGIRFEIVAVARLHNESDGGSTSDAAVRS
ncbi:endoribonuclease L-PSP [Ruaniaceae bacterium KH17]|nr:endoribonuclease L-PSP [Ruaniaceae bacterium KH17]